MDLHPPRGPRWRIAAGLLAAAALTVVPSAAPAATIETVARGLDNPRGVAIGPDGAVYAANTGRGGRQCQGRGEDRQCLGRTGRIVRVAGDDVSNVAKGFVSIAGPGGPFAIGVHGVSVAPDGDVFAVTASGPPGFIRSLPGLVRRQTGRIFDVSGGNLSAVARIDRVEWRQNLDNFRRDRNSNPYAVLAQADRQVVVDAGANAVLEVRGGQVSVLAVIPRNGRSQAVPTSIAAGPDGNLYVGELAGEGKRGKARVWRIPSAGGTPEVFARGFTAITGVAFGPDGSLFVTEFARNFAREDIRGRVVRIAPDGSRSAFGGRTLRAPTGAAVDASGAVYVSNFSVLPRRTPRRSPFRGAGGTLVKITP